MGLLNSKNKYSDVLTYSSKWTKMEADCNCGWIRGLPEQMLNIWRRSSTQPGGRGVRRPERELRKSEWLWEWLVTSTAKNKSVVARYDFFSRVSQVSPTPLLLSGMKTAFWVFVWDQAPTVGKICCIRTAISSWFLRHQWCHLLKSRGGN